MKFQRRNLIALSAVALAAWSFAAPASAARIGGAGHVYTMDNAVGGNSVLVYTRGAAGALTLAQTLATQGSGTGAGLGSQGAVTLSQDGDYLFVVNAGSGTLSTFSVGNKRLTLASTVATGGATPVSVTEFEGVVYVLNAGAGGNVSGFRNVDGTLTPLADGVRPLSDTIDVGAAEVSFDKLGRTVVVTEKATNRLTTYAARPDGTLGQPLATASSGATPFGFSFDAANHLIVSEAAGGAALGSAMSSYHFKGNAPQAPVLVSASVATLQTAACWTAVTPDGRFAFTANAGSASISSFSIAHNGALALVKTEIESSATAHPLDLVVSASGKRLFVLNSGDATIGGYSIGNEGGLSPLSVTTVPATSAGLAID